MHSPAGIQSLIVLSAPEESLILFSGLCFCVVIIHLGFPTFRTPDQNDDFPQRHEVGFCWEFSQILAESLEF